MLSDIITKNIFMKSNLIISTLTGIFLGFLFFSFYFAEGSSYFSSNPKACINCHIMEPQYDSWQKASHHSNATCVECHLPQRFFSKWYAKAENGFLHSKGFTLQNFQEPIFIKEKNKNILLENCTNCHQNMVSDILLNHHNSKEVDCIHCHSSVGHGNQYGIGKYSPHKERKTHE